MKVCLGIRTSLSRSELSGIVEAVIQPHEREGKSLQFCISRPLISLRFKVFKLSTKQPSPLSQSKPCQDSLPLRWGGGGTGSKGREEQRTQAQSELLEIPIVSIVLSKQTFIICMNFWVDFKRDLTVFPPLGGLIYYKKSLTREDFRNFPDAQ